MYDFEYAYFFYKMAAIKKYILKEEYSAKAYLLAAYTLDSYECYVEAMKQNSQLEDIPHIGKKMIASIKEIHKTGKLKELSVYEKKFNIKDYSILLSKGISPRLVSKLIDRKILSVYKIEENLRKHFTENEWGKIEKFKNEYQDIKGKYIFSYGVCLGKEIIDYLKKSSKCYNISFSKKFECCTDKIDYIDLICSLDGNLDEIFVLLKKWRRVYGLQLVGGEILGKTRFGMPFKLKSLEIDENLYTMGVMINNIKGDFHTHSKWSDGLHAIEEMAKRAALLGYEYLAITDHSISQHIANGLSINEALDEIDAIHNGNFPVKVLAGIEVDILPDGSLDYPDEVLARFDLVIAAVHSRFDMGRIEMRHRLETALTNPYVNILAHPTGRLLGYPGCIFSERKPYIDYDEIISICKKNNVILEVNCFPERLDLNVNGIKEASKQGIMIALGSDSHSVAHMSNMKYGCHLLEKAYISLDNVINTYSYEDVKRIIKKQRNSKLAVPHDARKTDVKRKDYAYYFASNSQIMSGKYSVVGIDLTGSEKKSSGWCLLAGNNVQCKLVGTDQEIINSIDEVKPCLVSIDSPLAYPKGRDCVNKNCACSRYGIMRDSERLLRHFGVPIYPCLIDSMVKLTTRGMRLARELRTKGYNVIESYPGVAQDVLKITRKGKTTVQKEHLKKGLVSFGLVGDLLTREMISHDELDAITSALVGYFYANGQYIAIGNEDEDYLIVPRANSDLLKKNIVIGLCGEIGAGKTTIAEYIRFKYGFPNCRYSKLISKLYHVDTRDDLQKIGAEIAKDANKQRGLTKELVSTMEGKSAFVVDGLRHIEDYQELKNVYGTAFKLVYVECRENIRFHRLEKERGTSLKKDDFLRIVNHEAERDIALLRFSPDYIVDNNKTFKALFAQIDDILKE